VNTYNPMRTIFCGSISDMTDALDSLTVNVISVARTYAVNTTVASLKLMKYCNTKHAKKINKSEKIRRGNEMPCGSVRLHTGQSLIT
jgi:hypothetical protein